MKIFCTIPNDGAVEVRNVTPGYVFSPRGYPKSLFLRVGGFGGRSPKFTVFERDCEYCIDSRTMEDMVAGVDVEDGRLVMFHKDTMVITLPSYLTTGKYEP